jgi:hypothetical protein
MPMKWLLCQDGGMLNLEQCLAIRMTDPGALGPSNQFKLSAYTTTPGKFINIFTGTKEDCERISDLLMHHVGSLMVIGRDVQELKKPMKG